MSTKSSIHGLTVTLTLALFVGSAPAADRYVLAGGEVAERGYYSYLGLVLPGPMRTAGQGFMQRYWLDRFGYEYDGAPGHVKARVHGAEAALGYSGSSASGWWGVYLGLRYTDTTLTPDDPGAKARGAQTGAKLQVEVDQQFATHWRAGAIASYVNQQDSYWSRVRLMHTRSAAASWGVEAIASGNRESRWRAAGAVLSLRPTNDWSVSFKTGYRSQAGAGGDGAYGGIELGLAF